MRLKVFQKRPARAGGGTHQAALKPTRPFATPAPPSRHASAQPDRAERLAAPSGQHFDGVAVRGRDAAVGSGDGAGLPEALRAGVEKLSGVPLGDVRVHYNSPAPARHEASAHTQGTHIHLAPGQERHLAHEAWHVVQQKQGRVRATTRARGGVAVNDAAELEREADVMGAKASADAQTASAGAERIGASRPPAPTNVGPQLSRAASLGHSPGAGSGAPVQCYKKGGEEQPGKYLRGTGEGREEFIKRMRGEMGALRRTMRRKDKGKDAEGHDYHGPQPDKDRPDEPRKEPNLEKRKAVLERIRKAQREAPTPRVAISYRGGYGYDVGSFTKGRTRSEPVPTPPNFKALPPNSDPIREPLFKARNPQLAGRHLQEQGASGLYIPGGQDATDDNEEKVTRENYEQALIKHARERGLPTLAICGGSRCFARGFGGQESELSKTDKSVHNKRGTAVMSHGLTFPDQHTILGGSAPLTQPTVNTNNSTVSGMSGGSSSRLGTLDKINSTHQKIVSYDKGSGELSPIEELPGTKETALQVSAKSPEGHPEGFETRYGAPMLGVTSHPEAIHGASNQARQSASQQGIEWSDNLFKAFDQSMRAYAGRQAVNRQLKETRKKIKRFNK